MIRSPAFQKAFALARPGLLTKDEAPRIAAKIAQGARRLAGERQALPLDHDLGYRPAEHVDRGALLIKHVVLVIHRSHIALDVGE